MKQRDLVYLLLAVTIFGVAGYLAYTQLLPQNANGQNGQGVKVERVGDIPPTLNNSAISTLQDSTKTQDYNSPTDLSGLNNTAPFGP